MLEWCEVCTNFITVWIYCVFVRIFWHVWMILLYVVPICTYNIYIYALLTRCTYICRITWIGSSFCIVLNIFDVFVRWDAEALNHGIVRSFVDNQLLKASIAISMRWFIGECWSQADVAGAAVNGWINSPGHERTFQLWLESPTLFTFWWPFIKIH